jgi:hypothetical protein
MLKDKIHKTFICRINGSSIYYLDKTPKRDAYKFVIIKDGKQYYDTITFVQAIIYLISDQNVTKKQIKRWIELSKEFDSSSTSRLESWLK